MKRFFLLLILVHVSSCTNPTHIVYPFQFLFQSDVPNIGLKKISLVLKAEKADAPIFLDSADFFVCPANNDTCDRRGYFTEVPNYTQIVPMTTMHSFTAADGNVSLTISIKDSTRIYLADTISFDRIIGFTWCLIYLGCRYEENNPKIKDFITVIKSDTRHTPTHLSFPISDTTSDSLYLIWVE